MPTATASRSSRELGPLANNAFGQVNIATRYNPETYAGFDNRRNNWEVSATVSHELMSRVAAELSYFRRAQGHFTTTDNLDVTANDFQQYCVTAPKDPRLPNGGGNQICGLYDITPTKFGVATNNVVNFVDDYGKQSEVFNGIDFSMNARIRSDLFVTGGFATGNTHFNNCDAFVDNPRTDFGISAALPVAGTAATPGTGLVFNYCDFDTSWLTQVKATGSYTLPWQQIQIGGVLQNLPGQMVLANWPMTQADAATGTLGRPLSGGANTSRTVPARQTGDDVHAAAHAARPARVQELQPERGAADSGDGRHLQCLQLERRGWRDLQRRRAAGGDQHDLRVGVAAAAEHPAGAVREVRRAIGVLTETPEWRGLSGPR